MSSDYCRRLVNKARIGPRDFQIPVHLTIVGHAMAATARGQDCNTIFGSCPRRDAYYG